ncbi:hypothetical protein [Kitasatospora cheerisanensis]|uniref:Uncharacterized protein n=1 Tax=Kitasatospora cheerisanensis KCTC 2395 TaxID=1348663 RepID=A0A066YS38_9ACTN|nr:hypothetical protein [Kitasatospora cheerisanensis]KDN84052.1 hypothetical protein KCH_38430 [Kitasatospora cheerisanensis KCTC 2395]
MNRTPAARIRAALASAVTAGLALLTVATPAHAAGGAPTTPTDLYNDYQACSTDQARPYYGTGRAGITVEGIPGHTDSGVQWVTAQYRAWPLSDPTQVVTAERPYSTVGNEAVATIGGYNNPLRDGETYAWQARTLDPAGGAASDWTAPCYVATDDTFPDAEPTVSSPNYPAGQANQGGAPITLNFGANGVSDLAGYAFTWSGSFPIAGGATIGDHGIPVYHDPFETSPNYFVRATSLGGPATVSVIPPNNSGFLMLRVAGLDRSLNMGPATTYYISVKRDAPTVTKVSNSPQYGKDATFKLTPDPGVQAVSPVVSYTVRHLGQTQTETTVPASAAGIAELKVTLNSPYGESLLVTSTSANGWVSQQEWWRTDGDAAAPTVTSDVYPEDAAGGGVGVPGTFTFAPKLKGAVSYTYSFNWSAETTVPAGGRGEAKISWTPTESGWYALEVHGTTKDGLQTPPAYYYFTVN